MFSLYNWHYAYKVALPQQQSKLVMHRFWDSQHQMLHAKRRNINIEPHPIQFLKLQESEIEGLPSFSLPVEL